MEATIHVSQLESQTEPPLRPSLPLSPRLHPPPIQTTLKSIGFNTNSEFQQVQIIETSAFGKTLILDGKTQSAQSDEFVYHECLVQPACAAVGWSLGDPEYKPKRAYIGGGGELATARELLKHASMEEVVMVDLDRIVVDVSREQLPEWNDGSTEDPRLKLFYTDARAWLDRDDEATGKVRVHVRTLPTTPPSRPRCTHRPPTTSP